MTQHQRLIQQAKSGNVDAIAKLLNQQLSTKGIQARVVATANGLEIALFGTDQVPSRSNLVGYLTTAFRRLQAEHIHQIQVSGWKSGDLQATWQETIILAARAPADGPSPSPTAGLSKTETQRSQSLRAPTSSKYPQRQTSSHFNGILFCLSWSAVTVPCVWLSFWMPQILLRWGARWQYLFENRLWILFIPLAIGQWLLLRPHLRGAYWWAIATLFVFYFETYPRALVSFRVLGVLYLLVGGPSGGLGTVLTWLSNGILGLVAGALVGVLQWLVLRRSLHPSLRTANWIWISAIAWSLGWGLPILVMRFRASLTAVFPPALSLFVRVIDILTTGVGPCLLAIITATTLSHWLRMAKRSSTYSSMPSP